MLERSHAPLARFVFENLPADDIRETARIAGISLDGAGSLRALPPASRSAALRGWMQAGDAGGDMFVEAHELVSLLDAADLELLLEDLRAAGRDTASQFIPFVWRASPDRALDEARVALDRSFPSAASWFYAAPREHIGRLADTLSTLHARPPWAGEWALHRLLEAGPAAEQLLALARGGAVVNSVGER